LKADEAAKSNAKLATGAASFLMIAQSLKDINPSPSAWAYINWIQIIRPISLLDTNITKAFSDFLNEDMGMFNLQIPYFESIASSIEESIESVIGTNKIKIDESFGEQLESYQFEIGKIIMFSITILLTCFSFTIFFSFLYIIGILLSILNYEKLQNLGNSIKTFVKNNLFFNVFIRIIHEVILQAFLHIVLYVRYLQIGDNLVRSIIGMSLTAFILISIILFVTYYTIKLKDPDNWSDSFKELYVTMRKNGLSVQLYFLTFFVRRFLIALVVAMAGRGDYSILDPYAQNMTVILIHCTLLAIVSYWRPFEDHFDSFQLIYLEFGSVFFTVPLLFFEGSMKNKRKFGR